MARSRSSSAPPLAEPSAAASPAEVSAPDGATVAGDGWLLATICLAPLVGFLLGIALSPFFPVIAEDLGTTVALLGQIPALTTLGAAALGLVVGPLADHYGYRRLLLLGLLAVVASALATALAPTFALLAAAGLFGAVSRAIVQPVALAIAGARFVGAARQRAISWVVAAIAGSAAVGVPLLTAIAALSDWRAAFVALGALALAAALLATRTLPADAPLATARLRWRGIFAAYGPLLRHPPTLGLIGSALLRNASAWAFFTYFGAFLVQEQGLSLQGAGWGYTGVGIGFLVGSLGAGGRIGARLRRPALTALTLAQGLLLATPILLPVGPLGAIVVLGVSAAVAGVTNVGMTVLLADESPAGRATTMTLNQAAFSIGIAVGSAAGGLLLAVGDYRAIGFGVVGFSCGAALLIRLSRSRPATLPSRA